MQKTAAEIKIQTKKTQCLHRWNQDKRSSEIHKTALITLPTYNYANYGSNPKTIVGV